MNGEQCEHAILSGWSTRLKSKVSGSHRKNIENEQRGLHWTMNKIGIESRQITPSPPKSSTQIRYPVADKEEGRKDVTKKYGVMRVRPENFALAVELFHLGNAG